MLKSQDVVVLTKLIACQSRGDWTQNSMATELCMSPSQVNGALKRLVSAKLITPYIPPEKPKPIIPACKEFLIYGFKYMFPVELGSITRGVATSYAAPSFKKQIVIGTEPIPIWPYGHGNSRGVAVKPLHPSLPKSIIEYPDQLFYDLLSLLDAIRVGRARERNLAIELLQELLK